VKAAIEFADAFLAQGLEVAPQRHLLFALLEGNTTPMHLVDMGELQAVTLGSGAMRFDPNVDDHHHGVCDMCGAVVDLYVDGADTLVVDGDHQITPRSASIIFHGTCATCAATD